MKCARLNLTDFELRVLTLMAHGWNVKSIAAQLRVTTKAVSSARRRALRRNGITNYLQLGMMIERCQSLPVDERNSMEDRREERLDARRLGAQ